MSWRLVIYPQADWMHQDRTSQMLTACQPTFLKSKYAILKTMVLDGGKNTQIMKLNSRWNICIRKMQTWISLTNFLCCSTNYLHICFMFASYFITGIYLQISCGWILKCLNPFSLFLLIVFCRLTFLCSKSKKCQCGEGIVTSNG